MILAVQPLPAARFMAQVQASFMNNTLENPELETAFELAPEQLASFDRTAKLHAVLMRAGEPGADDEDPGLRALETAALVAAALEVEFCGVSFADYQGQAAQLLFAHCDAAGILELVSLHELSLAKGSSASAFAIQEARPVAFSRLDQERRFRDEVLLQLHVSDGLVCPLVYAGQTLGTVGIFTGSVRGFSRDEELFVDSAARLLAATLAFERVERRLAEQTRLMHVALDSLDSLLIELSPEGRVVRFNQACQQTTGFSLNEVRDRHLGSALFLPEELPLLQQAFERLGQGESPVKFESDVLTKHGQRRRVAWSFTALSGADQTPQKLVGSGIDVTDLRQTREKLERSQVVANETQRALTELKTLSEDRATNGTPVNARGSLSESNADTRYHDRRLHARQPFPYIQVMAPMIDGTRPDPNGLCEVRCHDISPNGFSFYSETVPEYRNLMVAFGAPPAQIWIVARVMHVRTQRVGNQDLFLVGCMYLQRAANLPAGM